MRENEKIAFGSLSVELTRRCNLKCEHCMRGDAQNIDISKSVIDNLLEQVCVFHRLHFTGGEPFLAKEEMIYMLQQIRKKGIVLMHIQIITNGMLFDNEIAKELIETNKYIQSLYARITKEKLTDDFISHRIHLLISNDKYHNNNAEYQYENIKNMMGKYAYVKLYNDSDGVKSVGKAKSLNCGCAYVVNEPHIISIFGKGEKCICASINNEMRMEEPDYYTVMCAMNLTAKGIITQEFDSEFEEEDNEKYKIVDLSINENIVDSIRRYNKGKMSCYKANKIHDEKTRDKALRNSTREIKFVYDRGNAVKKAKEDDRYYRVERDGFSYIPESLENDFKSSYLKKYSVSPLKVVDLEYENGDTEYEYLYKKYMYLSLEQYRKLDKALKLFNKQYEEKYLREISEILICNYKKQWEDILKRNRMTYQEVSNRRKNLIEYAEKELNGNMDKLYDVYLTMNELSKSIDIEILNDKDYFESFINNEISLEQWIYDMISEYASEFLKTALFYKNIEFSIPKYTETISYSVIDEICFRIAFAETYEIYSKVFVKQGIEKHSENNEWNLNLLNVVVSDLKILYTEILKLPYIVIVTQNVVDTMINLDDTYKDANSYFNSISGILQRFKFNMIIKQFEGIYGNS